LCGLDFKTVRDGSGALLSDQVRFEFVERPQRRQRRLALRPARSL